MACVLRALLGKTPGASITDEALAWEGSQILLRTSGNTVLTRKLRVKPHKMNGNEALAREGLDIFQAPWAPLFAIKPRVLGTL